jgi:membrane-bound lytic murein transglycosylase B
MALKNEGLSKMLGIKPACTGFVFLYCFLILIFSFGFSFALRSHENDGYFESLKQKLQSDGFDKRMVEEIFGRPEVVFEADSISRYFMHKESKLNYDQFTSKKSIRSAKKYMKKYDLELASTEKIYGVSPKVITAILLVETRLGTSNGKRSVLNSLSTMAALFDSRVREDLWKTIPDSSEFTRQDFEKWAKRKSDWAYAELKAFLTYATRENINPTVIYGSYAGALGMAQFMPSNVLVYARDGNRDGKIDLFNHADAIASIASYLKHYGWHPEIDRKNARNVIFHYNHSNYYVDTIIRISDLL